MSVILTGCRGWLSYIGESANEPVISLVGESAMAGAIGGGLGDLAIRYGYQRFRPDIMIATVVVLIVMVQFEFIIFYSNFPHRYSFSSLESSDTIDMA